MQVLTHHITYTVSINDTDVAYYIFNAHQRIFVFFLAETLLREYASER